jgi:hypothetical protein
MSGLMRSLAAAALLSAVCSAPAGAHEWYLAHMGSHTCLPASSNQVFDPGSEPPSPSPLRSPLAIEQHFRRVGGYIGTEITRDSNGTLIMVQVFLRRHGEINPLTYFRDQSLCNRWIQQFGTASELQ